MQGHAAQTPSIDLLSPNSSICLFSTGSAQRHARLRPEKTKSGVEIAAAAVVAPLSGCPQVIDAGAGRPASARAVL